MTQAESQKREPFVIKWREGFRINIDEVDQEHQHFFTLIKALDLDTVEATLDELLEYIVTHFSNEQVWMERSGYPDLAAHVQQHRELGEIVVTMAESRQPWTRQRMQDLRRFLNRWLIGHILLHDLGFGKWYEKHQLAGGLGAPATTEQRAFFTQLFKRR